MDSASHAQVSLLPFWGSFINQKASREKKSVMVYYKV
jgi:hypothetical protein